MRFLWDFLDGTTSGPDGGQGVKQNARALLRFEQVRAIVRMTPAAVASSACASLILLAVCFHTGLLPTLLIWIGALAVMQLIGLRAWWRSRQMAHKPENANKAMRHAVGNAFVQGAIWGFVPILFFAEPDVSMRIAACIAVIAGMCAAAMALMTVPRATLAFTVPVIAATVWAAHTSLVPSEANVVTILVIAFGVIVNFISLVYARGFVRNLISIYEVKEQKDIIGLLLKEFEENSSDWLWEFDRTGRIDRVSNRFAAAAGCNRSSLVGRDFGGYLNSITEEDDPHVARILNAIAQRATFHDIEVRIKSEQSERWWKLTGKPAFDQFGDYVGYIGTGSDVSARKLAERRINMLAHNDPLTGLLNRAKFTEQLAHAVARLERYGSPFAVLYLDLDQFKLVNDTLGHMAGDKLLLQVADRIRQVVRQTDCVARLGGDEFAVIMGDDCTNDQAALVATRLIERICEPYEIEHEVVQIGLSVGIAMAPINGTRPDQLLRNADLALYRAKDEGRGTYRFFESRMDSEVRERRMLELELRQAVEDGQLTLHYQPLVTARSGRTIAFEALMRWHHPIRGMVPPIEFIPIAEQSGLIMEIGDWTIREACRTASRWPEGLSVAVNLSAKHFKMSDIVQVVTDALDDTGLASERLELEITESLLIENPDEVIGKLRQLKDLGVTIAMDDFGTGYSSLAYLMKFPFDKIKIDKSFIDRSGGDPVARDILRAVATLGKSLKIEITAEGVETEEQVAFLREIGCDQLQGFYFAKPLNKRDMARYLLRRFTTDRAEEMERAAATPAIRKVAG
ncbi:putative bifunctional diguanylate cyclase/phosphodiesterase [Cucumibacter marinus]|uniref:putative bifunctional diguanylate cyclase/phosphodiesterase n=1 Tax=Cucumibacter marinus TaxID=1121252 RepID=UPI00040EB241|nr:EAL domain-containing protein [Cucumibacter marinus]